MRDPDGDCPTVDVAIVTHQSANEIGACLESLERSQGSEIARVTVVDNDSSDGTTALVRENFPSVELIEAGSNTGFAAATNLAASHGRADFLLALNPDVSLEADTLSTLVSTLRSKPEVGIVGCRLLLPDGSEDHAARRSFPTPMSALSHFAGLSRRERVPGAMKEYLAPEAAGGGEVDAVNGALMLIRREWFDSIGGFDERYWMYMEDLDLCWRFRDRGWLTWYEPSVLAIHVKAASSGKFRSLKLNWAFHEGMLRFYRDHLASAHNPLYNLAVYAGVLVKFTLSALRSAVARAAQRGSGSN